MAESEKKSGSGLEVRKTKDNLLSMIPSGDEHNRCREAVTNEGAAVNICYQNDYTPLMFAVIEDHAQCLNELIQAGADVNVVDINGDSTLMLAVLYYASNVRGSVDFGRS